MQGATSWAVTAQGGLYLWTLIAIRFFRFSAAQRHAAAVERRRRFAAETLPTADVEAEFERLALHPKSQLSEFWAALPRTYRGRRSHSGAHHALDMT